MTMPLHCLLYSAMPILATSSGPLIPKVLSISYSCEKPSKRVSHAGERWLAWTSAQPRVSYHRQAMAVPAEPSVHVEATLMGKAGDDVLDGASKDVPVVR